MRVAILTAESPQGNLITARVLGRPGLTVCGILAARGLERGRPSWQSALRVGRRAASSFLAFKAGERLASRAAWWWAARSGRTPAIARLAALARTSGVPLLATRDVNDAATVERLRRWGADVAVSVHFTHKIGPAALATARLGMLNVHGALLPRNRGLFPYFWELANGDAEAGVTVHWIDDAIDGGDVVLQARVPIMPDETVSSLSWKGAACGAELVDAALACLADGRPLPRSPQSAAGASYVSWPTRDDVRTLRRRGRRFGSFAETWQRIAGARVGAGDVRAQIRT